MVNSKDEKGLINQRLETAGPTSCLCAKRQKVILSGESAGRLKSGGDEKRGHEWKEICRIRGWFNTLVVRNH